MIAIRKETYKLGRALTMIVPMILALVHVIHAIIYLIFGTTYSIVSLVGGSSLITTIYLYVMSFFFKLCSHHRMALYYMLFVNILYIVDKAITIPVNNHTFIRIVVATFGVCVILYGYLKCKENDNNKK